MTIFLIIGFILLLFATLYITSRFYIWSGISLVYLALMYSVSQYVGHTLSYIIVFTLLSVVYFGINCIVLIKPLRNKIFKPLYSGLQHVLPKISETEQMALNAGNNWFEREIFIGEPNWTKLHKIKKFQLNDVEQNFLNNEVEELCALVDDWVACQERDLPVNAWNYMREHKFFGLIIRKEYGGLGFSASAHSEIVVKIATKSPALAVTVMVPNSLGPGELLQHYGTDTQKNYYLPRLANGLDIPCFALTSDVAGSDATSITDEGVVCKYIDNGEERLGIKLHNINKRYITLAPVATLIGLAFQLKDPEGLLQGVGNTGITCALIHHDLKGLEIGNRLLPLHVPFMNGTIRIKEAFIPIDAIIGGQKMAGQGWKMLVECLSVGRSLSLPACGTAQALLGSISASAYANIREQFHTTIGNFEGIEEALAKISGLTYLANATRQFTVSAVDSGVSPSVASAIAKYHITEIGRAVINKAMDIHAGRGVIVGPNNYLRGAYDTIPVGITVEGANIMTRNLLIFGQGIMKCHPYLLKEYQALAKPNGLDEFANLALGHFGYFAKNKIRAIFHGFTNGIFIHGYTSKFKHYYKDITRMSSSFSYVTDVVLILLGGELKRKEKISARLGDMMSHLYMAAATLKYFKDNNERMADEAFVMWSVEYSLFQAEKALFNIFDNFPHLGLGKILKIFLFPYGRVFKEPSDKLEHLMSQSMLHNVETRKAWAESCYLKATDNTPLGKMEAVFLMSLTAKNIQAKIKEAIRDGIFSKHGLTTYSTKDALEAQIITQEEYKFLEDYAGAVKQILQVDEFAPFTFGAKNAHPDWHNIIN